MDSGWIHMVFICWNEPSTVIGSATGVLQRVHEHSRSARHEDKWLIGLYDMSGKGFSRGGRQLQTCLWEWQVNHMWTWCIWIISVYEYCMWVVHMKRWAGSSAGESEVLGTGMVLAPSPHMDLQIYMDFYCSTTYQKPFPAVDLGWRTANRGKGSAFRALSIALN